MLHLKLWILMILMRLVLLGLRLVMMVDRLVTKACAVDGHQLEQSRQRLGCPLNKCRRLLCWLLHAYATAPGVAYRAVEPFMAIHSVFVFLFCVSLCLCVFCSYVFCALGAVRYQC